MPQVSDLLSSTPERAEAPVPSCREPVAYLTSRFGAGVAPQTRWVHREHSFP